LVRSYQEKEENLNQVLKAKELKVDEAYVKLKALKRYARQLKYCAEDLQPANQPVPDILVQ